jgi:hypothetical protein
VNVNFRTNLSVGYFFRATNTREAETIADEQTCPLISRGEFQEMYAEVTRDNPHDFLTVNHDEKDQHCMYRHNLDQLIPIPFRNKDGSERERHYRRYALGVKHKKAGKSQFTEEAELMRIPIEPNKPGSVTLQSQFQKYQEASADPSNPQPLPLK